MKSVTELIISLRSKSVKYLIPVWLKLNYFSNTESLAHGDKIT